MPDPVATRDPSADDAPAARVALPRAGAVTARAVLIGAIAVGCVAAISPYNDYVVFNTFLIGGYLPLCLVLALFVLITLVNAPLHRWAPRRALRGNELATVVAMMLVGCSIPTQGLLRFWLPMLVAPYHLGRQDARFWRIFQDMRLPSWLFPVPPDGDGRLSAVVAYFYSRVPAGESAPYLAWILPVAVWGIFIAALWATLIALALLLRAQWATNERLAFPLAQVQLSLIEPPRPGKALNDLFRSRLFWIALILVFMLHNLSALHSYFPRHFPEFDLGYRLAGVFSEEPWIFLHWNVKNATIYFTFIGVAYFIQARIAFSLWATFLVLQLLNMQLRMARVEIPQGAWEDQHLGASVAFVIGVLWIGRHHWARILRHAFVGRTDEERRHNVTNYRGPFLVAVGGLIVMLAWLRFVGVGMPMALLSIGVVLLAHVVVSRIVAETGLPFFRFMGEVDQLFTLAPATSISSREVFFAQTLNTVGPFATRESALGFALHGFRVADGATPPVRRGPLVGAMALAMLLSFVVATASSLWCYYNFSTPLIAQDPYINPHGLDYKPRDLLVDPMIRHQSGQWTARPYSPTLHLTLGAAITGLLQFAAMRSSAWPFLPVGYVVSATWYIQIAWFSIFLGWLAKVLILRFGGARMFQNARPFFIGLIFGEALAAAWWLIVNLSLALAGEAFKPITVLPS